MKEGLPINSLDLGSSHDILREASFGGRKVPRPKIRGSQFIRREEKQKVKLQIQKEKKKSWQIFPRPANSK